MLVEHDGDVAARNHDGWTPLHLASDDSEGDVDIAPMVIDCGPDLIS